MLKLAGEDLVWDGTVLVIRLPEPELLDFAVEVGSVRFMSKSTALPKLLDISRGGWRRSVLEGRMKEAAMAYFRQQNLLPNRSEIAAQLNTAAPIIEASAGINLRFE